MSLIRFHYDPFVEFDRAFDDAFNARVRSCASSAEANQRLDTLRPKLDVHASKDSNTVTATFELPGLTSEDVTIDVHHDRLTVSGASSTSTSRKEDGYTIRERHSGTFSRTLKLPFGTKPEDVKAKMENGLLTVTFPKDTESQPHQIAIE